jgi:hypothetical protein
MEDKNADNLLNYSSQKDQFRNQFKSVGPIHPVTIQSDEKSMSKSRYDLKLSNEEKEEIFHEQIVNSEFQSLKIQPFVFQSYISSDAAAKRIASGIINS